MPRFCPRLRFSLRTLFVLITLLSIWPAYQLNWIRQRRQAREWLTEHGQYWPAAFQLHLPPSNAPPHPAPPSLRMFGEKGVYFFAFIPKQGDTYNEEAKIAELKRIFPEAYCNHLPD